VDVLYAGVTLCAKKIIRMRSLRDHAPLFADRERNLNSSGLCEKKMCDPQ